MNTYQLRPAQGPTMSEYPVDDIESSEHFDLDSPGSIFFWGDVSIEDGGQPPAALPEPGSLGLIIIGLLSVFRLRRRHC